MLKHQFFANFSAVPLSTFFAIAARLSQPAPESKIAFIKAIGKTREVALPARKVKSA